MQLFADIVQTYRDPRVVMARKMKQGLGEERLLGYLLIACLISFFLRIPELVLLGEGAGTEKMAAQIGAAFATSMIFGPLFFYGLAGGSGLVLRAIGRIFTWKDVRLALFWCLFALQPVVFVVILLKTFVGAPLVGSLFSTAVALGFTAVWLLSLSTISRSNP